MDTDYYKREYDYCSNRIEQLTNKRLENINKKPQVFDKTIITELARLSYKKGLLKSAIDQPSSEWSLHDHLLYHFDDDRDEEYEIDYDNERLFDYY